MENKIKKSMREIFLVVGILVLIISPLISAVGVSMYYYDGKPLNIAPGETKTIDVASLVATHETQDTDVEISLLQGDVIASVVGADKTIIAGSADQRVQLKFSIPSDVVEGTTYNIEIKVKETTAPEGTGMVGFGTSKITSFPVIVKIPESTPATLSTTWIIVGIIVIILVILVIWFIVKNKSAEPSKSEKPAK